MSSIDIRHAHALPDDSARQAIEAMAAKLTEKFSLETNWVGDALEFKGSGAKGLIALLPGQVHVTAELGFPVSMMKGMVENEIERVLKEKLG
ncbi:MAG: polyhydroxyalkanoic acid system family protein [Stenotrophomonas sp.]|uniref:polyhydroxyalkanoic acid system family protein n=1 Tax=Stenotrophomonas sp. TaxID=69392 RepID=UPI003D6D197D